MSSVRSLALGALGSARSGQKPKSVIERLSAGPDNPLDRRDTAFLTETLYGTLRYRDLLDWILKDFLKRPGRLSPETRDNLRLGAYQIFRMRVPEWAAVNEAVRIEKKSPALVNAVLRNAAREKERINRGLKAMEEAARSASTDAPLRAANISAITSHPAWLIKRWVKRFGFDEALALALANNEVPPLTLRVNTLRTTRKEMLERLQSGGIKAEPTKHSPVGIRLTGHYTFGELSELKGYVIAQDEAAQLVSYLMDLRPGLRVLDACAAPGGKTTHMAQLMEDRGEIVAVEKDERRIPALKENIETLGIKSVRVVHGDILELSDFEIGIKGGCAPFDRVLLDAPCSALGVIRRNPDVKYRYRARDLLRFGEKQRLMLRSAARTLGPGGTLVYATCSTEPEEGERVVGEFLKSSEEFFIIKEVPREFEAGGYLRTYPHRHGMDGFFGVKIGRRS